jgi:hypothetical protein
MREQLFHAMAKASDEGVGKPTSILTAETAEIIDLLYFGCLPFDSCEYTQTVDMKKLVDVDSQLKTLKANYSELSIASKKSERAFYRERREALSREVERLTSGFTVGVPDVVGGAQVGMLGFPMFNASQVAIERFYECVCHSVALVVALRRSDHKDKRQVTTQEFRDALAKVSRVKKFIVRRGFLNPESSKCLPIIREVYNIQIGCTPTTQVLGKDILHSLDLSGSRKTLWLRPRNIAYNKGPKATDLVGDWAQQQESLFGARRLAAAYSTLSGAKLLQEACQDVEMRYKSAQRLTRNIRHGLVVLRDVYCPPQSGTRCVTVKCTRFRAGGRRRVVERKMTLAKRWSPWNGIYVGMSREPGSEVRRAAPKRQPLDLPDIVLVRTGTASRASPPQRTSVAPVYGPSVAGGITWTNDFADESIRRRENDAIAQLRLADTTHRIEVRPGTILGLSLTPAQQQSVRALRSSL